MSDKSTNIGGQSDDETLSLYGFAYVALHNLGEYLGQISEDIYVPKATVAKSNIIHPSTFGQQNLEISA